MKINKSNEEVVVIYEDNKIKIYNRDRSINGVLNISGSELKKMYFGGNGRGSLSIQVTE